MLSEALSQAVKWRLLPANPADAVEPPRPQRREMAVLSAEQAAALIEAAEGTVLHMPILLAIAMGVRKGEILGLQWKDVDLKVGTLQVRRSLDVARDGPRFREPKTAKGRRLVALPAMAVEAIRLHRLRQLEERLRLGPDHTDLDLVCCLPDGRPIHNSVTRDLQALLRRAGIPKVRFHDLRHTHATFLLSQGVHLKIVSERLGHATVGITLDIHPHILPDMQREAAAKIDGFLGRKPGG